MIILKASKRQVHSSPQKALQFTPQHKSMCSVKLIHLHRCKCAAISRFMTRCVGINQLLALRCPESETHKLTNRWCHRCRRRRVVHLVIASGFLRQDTTRLKNIKARSDMIQTKRKTLALCTTGISTALETKILLDVSSMMR